MPHTNETTLLAGRTVTIRPIRPTDAAMEGRFIDKLSLETKHYRFFGAVKELSAEQLQRFCEVAGPQSVAFVATVQVGDREVEIGVCRFEPDSKADVREMAITISDEWQNKGLAPILMKRLISSARHYGVHELHTFELDDNVMMRDLARELGMTVHADPMDSHQVIYSLAV